MGQYSDTITEIFSTYYSPGITEFTFRRDEISLNVKNLGDVIYTYRYRSPFPKQILDTEPAGLNWIIKPSGDASYTFKLAKGCRITPDFSLPANTISDLSSDLVKRHRTNDEQAALSMIRENRILDLFLNSRLLHMQNHLRTNVPGLGQVEVDDLYIGHDSAGNELIVPVQAKRGHDQIGPIQTYQDIRVCEYKWPSLSCRPISIYYDPGDKRIAILELSMDMQTDSVSVVSEKHFKMC